MIHVDIGFSIQWGRGCQYWRIRQEKPGCVRGSKFPTIAYCELPLPSAVSKMCGEWMDGWMERDRDDIRWMNGEQEGWMSDEQEWMKEDGLY